MRPSLAASAIGFAALALASCGGGGTAETPGERITDPARVASAEPLQNPTLFKIVGNEVFISGGATGEITPSAATTPTSSSEYEIQEGDFCSSIAAEYGITVDDLLKANRTVDCDNLRIGDKLKIPAAATATPTGGAVGGVATPRPGTTSGGAKTYTVQAGDTCGAIAAEHGVTVAALLAANSSINSECGNLREGETVSIP